MYEYIEGQLVSKTPAAAILEAGGVGYHILIPLSTYNALPASGRAKLLTFLYVREDCHRLYGFATAAERQVFLKLMDVPKVGPGLALAVLSGLTLADLRQAVLDKRPDILKRVKGVGAATAERIVRELRGLPAGGEDSAPGAPRPATAKEGDLVAALLTLGYQRSTAEKAAAAAIKSLGPGASLQDLIPEALKVML
ncbi:MAG TPA: Holliday junction ATP-dependent DNA helicase RuvA [Candidatus Brocadiia bacterium]|nr:Holliday junction ATP-dependent DNA helicase RuvA [Candidatus Brocadiia bacterium]